MTKLSDYYKSLEKLDNRELSQPSALLIGNKDTQYLDFLEKMYRLEVNPKFDIRSELKRLMEDKDVSYKDLQHTLFNRY